MVQRLMLDLGLDHEGAQELTVQVMVSARAA